MPIKEEPVRIEFHYEQSDTNSNDGTFKVVYFSETEDGEEKKYLSISPEESDDAHTFEVDFFVEVVDFLRKKGIINKEDGGSINNKSKLPLPRRNSSPLEQTEVEPLDISITDIESEDVESVENTETKLSPPSISKSNSAAVRISAPEKDSPPNSMPIINRPVIRTRVGDNDDPMQAYADANRQRQVNPEKTIRRSEE